MGKFGKIIGILVAVVVVLAVAVLILAKVLITPERVRQTVLPVAEKALQREVRLGDIEVSLFSGIVLKNLEILEPKGEDTFVAAEQVVLRYQLLPLLFMRVVVDEVRLVKPQIRVTRLTADTFNFSDLMASKKAPEAAPADAESAEPKEGQPLDLLVSEVGIDEGEVLLLDYSMNAKAPYRFKLNNLNVNARDISLSRSFPFNLSAQLNGSTLKIDGQADPSSQTGQAQVKLSNLDVAAFTPYFRQALPGKLGSLKLDLDLVAEGGARAITSSGQIALKDLDLVLDAMKDAPLEKANLRLDYGVRTDLAAARVDIDKADLDFNGIGLKVKGRVENYSSKPLLDAVVETAELNIRSVLAAVPQALVKDLGPLDPNGVVHARLNLAGAVDAPVKLLKDGTVQLKDVQATMGELRPALTGTINLKGDSASASQLQLKAGENLAFIDFTASNLLGKPIAVTSQINAERFLLDPLLKTSAAPAAATAKAPAAPSKGKAEELGPFDLPLKADGKVRIGKTIYQGLNIDNFALDYRLVNNVLTVDRLTGNIAGGSFNQTARVDLGKKGLDYKTNLDIQGVQADPMLSAFLPKAAGVLFGSLNLKTDMSGTGTMPEALKRNLFAKGNLVLGEGKLTGAGLVQGLADYLNLPELRELYYSQAKGSYTIEQGQVRVSSDFSGRDVSMAPKGTLGLDGSVDLALNLKLSPKLTQKLDSRGKFGQFLTDAQGWGEVPLKVTGTATSPRFALDTSAVKGKVEQKAKEEIQKKLQEKVFDKLAPKEGEQQDPNKKLLQDTLKGLFGN